MPKGDKERLAVLETTSEQNMLDHKEIKIAIDKLTKTIEEFKTSQDAKLTIREEKFVMKKELWAVSSVVGFVAVIIGIILNFTQ